LIVVKDDGLNVLRHLQRCSRLQGLSKVAWIQILLLRMVLVAVGEVDAGVDLDELRPEDVRVMGDKVFINLPEARIIDSSLDEDKTSLYDRDRGLFRIRGNDELIDEARRDAEDRMVEAARKNGILDKAQNNAETSIRTLVTSLGYDEVQFT
jgi:hypothetical protein